MSAKHIPIEKDFGSGSLLVHGGCKFRVLLLFYFQWAPERFYGLLQAPPFFTTNNKYKCLSENVVLGLHLNVFILNEICRYLRVYRRYVFLFYAFWNLQPTIIKINVHFIFWSMGTLAKLISAHLNKRCATLYQNAH